jgi:hypothetical protein
VCTSKEAAIRFAQMTVQWWKGRNHESVRCLKVWFGRIGASQSWAAKEETDESRNTTTEEGTRIGGEGPCSPCYVLLEHLPERHVLIL